MIGMTLAAAGYFGSAWLAAKGLNGPRERTTLAGIGGMVLFGLALAGTVCTAIGGDMAAAL